MEWQFLLVDRKLLTVDYLTELYNSRSNVWSESLNEKRIKGQG